MGSILEGIVADNSDIKITVYLKKKRNKYGNVNLQILQEAEAKKELSQVNPDQKEEDKIIVINTWWKTLSWRENNDILTRSMKVSTDGTNTNTNINIFVYRDLKLKKCLKKWDLKGDDGKELPITIIDKLNPDIVAFMIDQFEEVTGLTEEQAKN
jgi:hypothetical protein